MAVFRIPWNSLYILPEFQLRLRRLENLVSVFPQPGDNVREYLVHVAEKLPGSLHDDNESAPWREETGCPLHESTGNQTTFVSRRIGDDQVEWAICYSVNAITQHRAYVFYRIPYNISLSAFHGQKI